MVLLDLLTYFNILHQLCFWYINIYWCQIKGEIWHLIAGYQWASQLWIRKLHVCQSLIASWQLHACLWVIGRCAHFNVKLHFFLKVLKMQKQKSCVKRRYLCVVELQFSTLKRWIWADLITNNFYHLIFQGPEQSLLQKITIGKQNCNAISQILPYCTIKILD